MEKSKVIEALERGLRWEDEFVMDYDKDIVWELLKTVGKGKFKRIKALLNENIADSVRHSSYIKSLLEKVRSGEYGT